MEAENVLNHSDAQLRAAAYKALRETTPDILPYATRLATDSSAFVSREVAVFVERYAFQQKPKKS
jgi:hypothetical protein